MTHMLASPAPPSSPLAGIGARLWRRTPALVVLYLGGAVLGGSIAFTAAFLGHPLVALAVPSSPPVAKHATPSLRPIETPLPRDRGAAGTPVAELPGGARSATERAAIDFARKNVPVTHFTIAPAVGQTLDASLTPYSVPAGVGAAIGSASGSPSKMAGVLRTPNDALVVVGPDRRVTGILKSE